MDRETAFRHDQIMALHRHAYRVRQQLGKEDEWYGIASRFGLPAEAWAQFWKTAGAALDAGMPAELAFPYAGQLYPPC